MKILFVYPHSKCCDKFIPCLESLKKHSGEQDVFVSYFLSDNEYINYTNENIKKIGHNLVNFISTEKQQSCSYNWNRGIEFGLENKYDFIVICNDDILYSENWLESILSLFKDKPLLDYVHPMLVGEAGLKPEDFDEKVKSIREQYKNKYNSGTAFGAAVTRPSFWGKLGLFDESFFPFFYEDIDMAARMMKNEDVMYCTTGNSFCYHFCSETVSKVKNDTKNVKKKYEEKWANFNVSEFSSLSVNRIINYMDNDKFIVRKRKDNNTTSSLVEPIVEDNGARKKVIYISYFRNDFLDDTVFCGLRYFLEDYDIYYIYPNNMDYLSRYNSMTFSYKEDYRKTASLLKPYDPNIDYDICIVGQLWKESQDCYNSFKSKVKFNCVLDGMDGPCSPLIKYDLLLRRETGNNDIFLPFSCPFDLVERENFNNTLYDINCQLSGTHPHRREVVNYLINLNLEKTLISYQEHGGELIGNSEFTKSEYWWDILEKSKIIINDRGAGRDSYRFWESMATGNFVLSSRHQIINNLPVPPNVFWFDDVSEMKEIINKLKKVSHEELLEIRKESKKFIKENHLPYHRAKKVFNNIKERIN